MTSDLPPYSVLMSVYSKDNPLHLVQSIESMLNQTYLPSDFVIVCDGPLGSELNEIIERYAYSSEIFSIQRLPENRGLGIALNEGLALCRYEIIARMDSDDVSVPERCRLEVECLVKNSCDIVGSAIAEFLSDPERPSSYRRLPRSHDEIARYSKKRNPFNHMTVMMKKTVAQKNGGYRTFHMLEDYDLWIRMLEGGARAYNLDSALVRARVGNGMHERRGGLDYAKTQIRFFTMLHKKGYIGRMSCLNSILSRGALAIVPTFVRKITYRIILR